MKRVYYSHVYNNIPATIAHSSGGEISPLHPTPTLSNLEEVSLAKTRYYCTVMKRFSI